MHKRFFVALLAVVLAACGCAKKTTAPTPEPTEHAFHEDFNPTNDGKIDPTRWNLSLGDGAAGLTGGTLTLENYGTGDFPYLTSKVNPFPTEGDFVLRVGVRYPRTPGAGTGFGPNWWIRGGFWVWNDYNGFSAQVGDSSVTLTRHDTAYHVFEWRCVGGTYSMTVDGESKGSSNSGFRPNSIFFGHPPYESSTWTTLEIDFVHIDPL